MKTVNSIKTVPNSAFKVLSEVNAEMLRNNPGFSDRLPELTQENLRDYGEALLSWQPTQNEFIDTLVNLIGRIWIEYRMFTNPLRALKKGMLEYGDTVELMYTNLAKAHQFDPEQAESEWMKREIPDVATAFAKRNYQVFYKATISDDQLRAAFMGWGQLSDFINSVFNSLYSGAENDEYKSMLQLLDQYGEAGKFAVITVPDVTNNDAAHEALAKIKALSNKMKFMRGDFNSLGVITATPKENQVLLIDADWDAYLDVQGYATLFNLEPARAQYRKIVVDDFPATLAAADVHAILVDEDFYACWDCLQKFTRDMNGQGLYWQYWAHYWRILAVCPFANAVAITTTAPTVKSVTVTPATPTVNKGNTIQFNATVAGTGLYPKIVTWSISGNTDPTTNITPLGAFTMGSAETGTITVTATSVFDTGKSGNTTVTIGA